MRRIAFFAPLLLTLALLLAGCSTQDGPNLFSDSEDLENSDTADSSETEGAASIAQFEDGDEFGMQLEGTQCVKQLHGGCVPFDSREYDNHKFGLKLAYPSDWNVTGASDRAVTLTPRDRSGEDDPTQLFAWRAIGVNEAYEVIQATLVEEGTGLIGPYEVTWEIYEGEWNGLPVKSEWVWLVYDEEVPYTNYLFMLVTEPENFEADQQALMASVSSVVE